VSWYQGLCPPSYNRSSKAQEREEKAWPAGAEDPGGRRQESEQESKNTGSVHWHLREGQRREGLDSLIEVGLRDGQETAVPVGPYGEHEGLASEYCQLTHHFPRMCKEQAGVFLAVNLPLVHMQQSRDHKQDVDILTKSEVAWPQGDA
jgi:hypothetical protein